MIDQQNLVDNFKPTKARIIRPNAQRPRITI